MKTGLPGLLALVFALAAASHAQEGSGSLVIEQPPVAADAGTETAPAAAPIRLAPQRHFYNKLFTFQAFLATVPAATIQQLHNWPSEWGTQRVGFEKRAASLYGQFVIGSLFEDGIKAIHPEDTRYVRLGKGNFFRRTSHAIADTFSARNPQGGRTPAYSILGNAYGSWAVATLWSPREFRNPASVARWGSAGMGTVVSSNVLREFWPDLKGFFHKTKTP